MAIKRRNFVDGIKLKPTTTALTEDGQLSVDSADDSLKVHLAGDTKVVVTDDQTQTLTNKTINTDNNTISNIDVTNLRAGVLDTDLSAVSALDDTLPSAKAVKDYVDTVAAGQDEANEIAFNNVASGLTATNVQAMGDELDANVDDLVALSGVALNSENLGVFTGTTIVVNRTVKGALQDLETAHETLGSGLGTTDGKVDNLVALSGVAANSVNLGTFTGTTITNNVTVKGALQEVETAHELTDAKADDLVTLSGVAANAVNLGTFTGTTITDNVTVKTALQELETSVEGVTGDLSTHEGLSSGVHGVTGSVVGTTDTQTLTSKTLTGAVLGGSTVLEDYLSQPSENSAATGASAVISNPTKPVVRLTDGALSSVSGISALEPVAGKGGVLTLVNATGVAVQILNDAAAAPAESILTGTGAAIELAPNGCLLVQYDTVSDRWRVIGGAGGGSGEGGVGSVDILDAETFNTAAIGDFAVTGTATLTTNALEVLQGDQSLKLDHAAVVTVKKVLPVDAKFRGKNVTLSVDLFTEADSGNLSINVYDETNLANIVVSEVLLPQETGESSVKRTVSFDMPAACEEFSWTITGASQAATISVVDNVVIELTDFREVLTFDEPDSALYLKTVLGNGSTNTRIRRFDLISNNTGSAIQYSSSATDGDSITILEEGIYDVSYCDGFTSAITFGISINSNQLTTDFPSISDANRLAAAVNVANAQATATWSGLLRSGDVLRPHNSSTSLVNAARSHFSISKVGKAKVANVVVNQKAEIPSSELIMKTANSRGSVDTAIVRFQDIEKLRGDALEVVSTVENGTFVTVKKRGYLSVSFSAVSSIAFNIRITRNQTDLTSFSPPANEILATDGGAANGPSNAAWSGHVEAGDIIRPVVTSGPGTSVSNQFSLFFQEQELQVGVSNLLPQFSESDSSVRVDTANGYGSTATKIRRFSNVRDNIGADVVYADSATLGGSFTVQTPGIYHISHSDQFTSNTFFGISKNASSLTTSIEGLSAAERLAMGTSNNTSGYVDCASWQGYLQKDDVIRAHSQGTASSANDRTTFTISKVGKPNVTGVDVTPFAAIEYESRANFFRSASSSTFVSNILRFTTLDEENGNGLMAYSDDATDGTRFTAVKSCYVDVHIAYVATTSHSGTIRKNGSVIVGTMLNPTGTGAITASASILLAPGDYIDLHRTGANVSSGQAFSLVATEKREAHQVIGGSIENVYSATISSAPAVLSESVPFIASVTSGGAGIRTINFEPGFFTVAPMVTGSAQPGASSTENDFFVVSVTTSAAVIRTTNNSILTNTAFAIMVQRQGADYRTPSKAIGMPISADKLNTAEGLAPSYSARAWVSFDGTTTPPTIHASGNVSSVTRASTGVFDINFTTAMASSNYTIVGSKDNTSASSASEIRVTRSQQTTTVARVRTLQSTSPFVYNESTIYVAIFE